MIKAKGVNHAQSQHEASQNTHPSSSSGQLRPPKQVGKASASDLKRSEPHKKTKKNKSTSDITPIIDYSKIILIEPFFIFFHLHPELCNATPFLLGQSQEFPSTEKTQEEEQKKKERWDNYWDQFLYTNPTKSLRRQELIDLYITLYVIEKYVRLYPMIIPCYGFDMVFGSLWREFFYATSHSLKAFPTFLDHCQEAKNLAVPTALKAHISAALMNALTENNYAQIKDWSKKLIEWIETHLPNVDEKLWCNNKKNGHCANALEKTFKKIINVFTQLEPEAELEPKADPNVLDRYNFAQLYEFTEKFWKAHQKSFLSNKELIEIGLKFLDHLFYLATEYTSQMRYEFFKTHILDTLPTTASTTQIHCLLYPSQQSSGHNFSNHLDLQRLVHPAFDNDLSSLKPSKLPVSVIKQHSNLLCALIDLAVPQEKIKETIGELRKQGVSPKSLSIINEELLLPRILPAKTALAFKPSIIDEEDPEINLFFKSIDPAPAIENNHQIIQPKPKKPSRLDLEPLENAL